MGLQFEGTVLLLHCNGADGSVTFTDETGKVVTAYGDAQISTAQSKFGGASMRFDGSGDAVSVAASDDWNLGKNYTIEFFAYPLSLPAPGNWCRLIRTGENYDPLTFVLQFTNDGAIAAGIAYTNATGVATGAGVFVTNEWHHYALSVINGYGTWFKDGVNVGEGGITAQSDGRPFLFIGYDTVATVNSNYNGYLEDLRITKHIAVYTSTFTPPAAPLEPLPPVQVSVQSRAPYGPPLAHYNPAVGKPIMQAKVTDLTDQLPYGIPNTPIVNNTHPWEYKGRGRITGTVKNTPNTPVRRLLRLYREPGGLLVKSTWSDPTTGAYVFDGVSMDYRYTVVSFDHTQAFRAVIADRVLPEAIP